MYNYDLWSGNYQILTLWSSSGRGPSFCIISTRAIKLWPSNLMIYPYVIISLKARWKTFCPRLFHQDNCTLHVSKEVKIVYRLFLVNCYLLHVPRLPSQPASTGGRLSDWLNWLELAWQYIAITRNNLSIIWISLKGTIGQGGLSSLYRYTHENKFLFFRKLQ